MSVKSYDITIIGGSLAARIAAALLAKSGRRVLLLRCREETAPAWFHSSLFLEKLLGILGGRSCFVAPRPIQVISRHARVTLHTDQALELELERELGRSSGPAIDLLNELQQLGQKIEELLLLNGGLPWPTLMEQTAFRFLCLRHKLKLAELAQPISGRLSQLSEPGQELLGDLLQGLTLLPIEQISVGKAALAWAQASRPENLKEPDFSQLLTKRLDQFHGAKGDLDQLQSLEQNGQHWTGGEFKEGGGFTSKVFILGDMHWLGKFGKIKNADLPGPQPISRYALGNLAGQVSPLLSSRVICGGRIPMRLAIDPQDEILAGRLVLGNAFEIDTIKQQLEPILPFAKYALQPIKPEDQARELRARPEKGLADIPLLLAGNLYCVDSTALLPGLGAAGAALLAWTLAEQLGGPPKTDKRNPGKR